jgi:hypothetical protein
MKLLKYLLAIIAIVVLLFVVIFIAVVIQNEVFGVSGPLGIIGGCISVGIMLFLSPKIWKKITKN